MLWVRTYFHNIYYHDTVTVVMFMVYNFFAPVCNYACTDSYSSMLLTRATEMLIATFSLCNNH